MNDITMCSGRRKEFICPLREKCYRFTAKADRYWQSYFTEIPYNRKKNECKYFWDNEEKKKKENDQKWL